MVSLITVLNGNVWAISYSSYIWFVAHLVCLSTGLNGSFITLHSLSVLDSFGLFCYQYQMDLSVQLFDFPLSICSFIFGWLNCCTECDVCSDSSLLCMLALLVTLLSPWLTIMSTILLIHVNQGVSQVWVSTSNKGFILRGFPGNNGFSFSYHQFVLYLFP